MIKSLLSTEMAEVIREVIIERVPETTPLTRWKLSKAEVHRRKIQCMFLGRQKKYFLEICRENGKETSGVEIWRKRLGFTS